MYRHARLTCKAASPAKSSVEDTTPADSRQDLLAQVGELRDQLAAQRLESSRQMAELAALVRALAVPPETKESGPIQARAGSVTNIGVVNGPVTNNTIQLSIRPWDGEDGHISVPVGLISAAFAENPRLAEYAGMGDEAKTDPEVAGPFILETLIDLTRRAHADPVARNIYLNPLRADQVLVCLRSGAWEVRSLEDATRLMFEGVATGIRRAIRTDSTRTQLSTEVQGSVSYVPMLYDEDPNEYVKRAKVSISAHLANTAPREGRRQRKIADSAAARSAPVAFFEGSASKT
jgi:hypothetical protein